MDSLDLTIRNSLLEFASFVARENWYGREREAVSLYALGFLIPLCRPGTPLSFPTQVGLDVAVPQLPAPGRKPQVCKDLVIWESAAETCWDGSRKASRWPLAILEWNVRTDATSQYDEAWLREASAKPRTLSGYAVALDPKGDRTTLSVTLARAGRIHRRWMTFPAKHLAV